MLVANVIFLRRPNIRLVHRLSFNLFCCIDAMVYYFITLQRKYITLCKVPAHTMFKGYSEKEVVGNSKKIYN